MTKRRTERANQKKERRGKKPPGESKYEQKGGPHRYGDMLQQQHPTPDRRNKRQRLY